MARVGLPPGTGGGSLGGIIMYFSSDLFPDRPGALLYWNMWQSDYIVDNEERFDSFATGSVVPAVDELWHDWVARTWSSSRSVSRGVEGHRLPNRLGSRRYGRHLTKYDISTHAQV